MFNSKSGVGGQGSLSNPQTANGNLFGMSNSRSLSKDTDTYGRRKRDTKISNVC